MKKVTFLWSFLLLLLLGTGTAKAQVEPQISTDAMVYEYYMRLQNRYVRNDFWTNSSHGDIIRHDGTLSTGESGTSLRIKLVKTEGDYFRIIPLNVTGYENGYICAKDVATPAQGTPIRYSTKTTNSEWKLYAQDLENHKYHVLLKGYETLGLSMNSTGSNATSTIPSTLLVAANYANANSLVYFYPANDNATKGAVIPKVETIRANIGTVGYLEKTNALYTTLNDAYTTFIGSNTVENLTLLETAYNNYVAATTGVVQPSEDTWYQIHWYYTSPKGIYNDGDVKWGAFAEGKNTHYWKIVDGKLMNGNGQYIKWDGTDGNGDHLTMTDNAAEASTGITFTVLAGDNRFSIKFTGSRYFHANQHSSGSGSGSNVITYDTSAGASSASAWRVLPVSSSYTQYTVKLVNAPAGATITRTTGNVTEKALDGGFFMYAAGTAPSITDFTATEVEGKFAKYVIDAEAKTITVKYETPVIPTTITGGNFAADTQWYFMQFTGSRSFVTNNGLGNLLTPNNRASAADVELWCFVEAEDGSYKIYNKASGTTHVLAASATMTGDQGSDTHVTLQPVASLPEGYADSWDFSRSTSIANVEAYYLNLHGHSSSVINLRNNVLAFWTGGKDGNSTFIISPAPKDEADKTATIDLTTGSFVGTGSYHSIWYSNVCPGMSFGTGKNNMMADNVDGTLVSCFTGSGCTYTLTAPAGYIIKSYSLDFALRSDNADASVTFGGMAATVEKQTLSNENCNLKSVTFDQSGDNEGVTLSNFTVVVARQTTPVDEYYEVFPAPYKGVEHRIPAIAQAKNGNLIAVADYRYSGQDIGMATGAERRLDLNFSLSTDNGKTWNGIHTLIAGQGAPSDNQNANNLNVAYGDPCIVVDRESGKVLVMSCAGNVSYSNGTPGNHQYIVTMRSEDNGATWSSATDVTEQFYGTYENDQFLGKYAECTIGKPKAMFIGSGKISQSQYIKKEGAEYYRIYCAVLFKDVNNVEKNYVYYSDDFGETWDVLGGVNVAPIPSGANEPKADELPDGSVVVSSRVAGGRKFNIFHYTDTDNAEGSWGTSYNATKAGNGPVDGSNQGTNGEILTVPVMRKADGKKMFLCLQSVPLGPKRANVAIYYKALESLSDFDTAEHLASDWNGHYQACYFSSGYTTMTWLSNNTLGFLYEEDMHGKAYSIVYKNYTIEKLTNDAYEYCGDVDESVMLKEGMAERMETVESNMGPYVGNLTYGGYMSISNARDAFMATPSKMAYAAFNKAVAEADYRQIEAGREYRINNKPYPAAYLTLQASGLTKAALDENSAAQKLTFHASGTSWKIKGDGAWMCKTNANDACPNVTTDENDENIGLYDVIFDAPGTVYIRCTNPGNANRPYLHLSNGTTLMSWTSAAETSLWRIQPVDSDADELIGNIILDCEHELAMAGKVGYPAASDATVEPFQNAIAAANEALTNSTATTTIYNDLVAKRTAYKSLTDVVMPEDGKAYVFTNIHGKGEQYNAYINYADGTARYVVRGNTAAADLPSSAKFICKVLANGKYAFVNNAGKYLILKGGGSYSNSAKGESSDFADAYNTSGYSDVYVAKESLFGTLKLVFKRDNSHYSPMVHTVSSNGVHSFNQYNDGNQTSTSSSVSGDHSTAFRVEEVPYTSDELPLIPTLNAATIDGENMNISTFSAPFATIIPENAKAFYVSAAGETAMLTRIDGIIPANTGVILTSTTGTANAALLSSSEENMPISGNLLVANPTARNFAGETNTYVLGGKNGVIAFYKATTASTTLGANKAYLEIPGGTAPALLMTFGNGEATGIEGVEGAPAAQEGAIFDLSGRRVLNPTKGLYIIGGKKVYIK